MTGNESNNMIDTWVHCLQEELRYRDYKSFRKILIRIQAKGYIILNKDGIVVNCNTNDIRANKKRSTKKGYSNSKNKKMFTSSRGIYDNLLCKGMKIA
jgi:hypothetical protein